MEKVVAFKSWKVLFPRESLLKSMGRIPVTTDMRLDLDPDDGFHIKVHKPLALDMFSISVC